SRLDELLDEDITGDGSLPNMTWLDEEYPQLMEYLYKGGIGKPSLMPSQLCQLASDLFGMAADEFWVDEM
ncbi:MAG: hypothetical protein KDE51_26665, partial [Anaerolineales bacterium]|nr:hypothetical protein [Anaerolineales bacterium]